MDAMAQGMGMSAEQMQQQARDEIRSIIHEELRSAMHGQAADSAAADEERSRDLDASSSAAEDSQAARDREAARDAERQIAAKTLVMMGKDEGYRRRPRG